MKRAENCVDNKINHITIRNDALVFHFAKSKGHQNGEEHVGPWHLYANPEHPHICVVLSLARYIFTYPQLLKEDSNSGFIREFWRRVRLVPHLSTLYGLVLLQFVFIIRI